METSTPYRASGRPRKGLQICFQCRNRKVRCDGTAGGCENCRRLKFHCSFSVPDTDQLVDNSDGSIPRSDPSHLRLEKRRVRRACVQCRDKKTKCCGTQPMCRRCLSRGAACQYPDSATNHKSLSSTVETSTSQGQPAATVPNDSASGIMHRGLSSSREVSIALSPASSLGFDLVINKTIIKQHIDAFFDYVYPIPCYGFVHKATFCQSWAQGTYNPRLLKSICGLTGRYLASSDSTRLQQSTRWIHEAETELLMRLSEPSMSDIEALMLTTMDHIIARRFSKMLVSACLAARLAYMMRLNYEDGRHSFITQERRRRLMWAIFTLDTMYSSGRAEFTGCSKDTIHLQLPCNERSFTLDIPVITEPLASTGARGSSELGLMAYNIRVLDIRDRIQRLSHTITHHRKPLPECIVQLTGLADELEKLRRSVPQQYNFDKKNLFLRAYTPQRTPFVMFHAWWHQCHCDMYRFTIPGFREGLPVGELQTLSPDYVTYCRDRCLEHALAVADIMDAVTDMGKDIFITDPALAMCAFHSARVISRLGSPQFSRLPRAMLISKLKACSDILEIPAEMYPTTKLLRSGISDLIHDAERDSGDTSPIRSNWETEQSGTDTADSVSARSAIQQNGAISTAEIYSKYSVTDEIRKLRFQQDGEDDIQRYQSGEVDVREDEAVTTTTKSFILPQPVKTDDNQPYITISQDMTGTEFGFPQAGLGTTTATYDVSMTLGFEPSYGDCQPDLFLDSFMPLQNDWNLADPASF
ncbi:nitrate assimilation regulatory protein [Colletotrichum truncatum]|uniref:Nitrate assimilation regulatory protein n=1 Tax=Colletotrichum truncatum TaxID=5467 RepID=A0ACC3Z2X0_COLTU|nr:nitrate assimilation regulatory protein [Colletotrichum truncatum]KAF6793251.1 nitrate assimilation regulatory protein [Colletotrichum truncatum]